MTDGFERNITSAEQANAAHLLCTRQQRDLVYYWLAIGDFLNRERETCPHGQWLPRFGTVYKFSRPQADIYMELSRNREKLLTISDLQDRTQRQLLAQCKNPS